MFNFNLFPVSWLLFVFFEYFLGNSDCRHGARPSRVEGHVRDELYDFFLLQTILDAFFRLERKLF